MADISQITLPNGDTYNLKDSVARAGAADFIGATSSVAGVHGLVPAPNKPNLLLGSNGTWNSLVGLPNLNTDNSNALLIQHFLGNNIVGNSIIPVVTPPSFEDNEVISEGAPGVMSAADKVKLDGIATNATVNVPSTTIPLMDGTAATGSLTNYARGDHIHPTDTSRAPLVSPNFSGIPTAPTANPETNNTQIATTAFVKAAISANNDEILIDSMEPTSESIKLWIKI